MKARHVAGARLNARATLEYCNVAIGAKFDDLRQPHIAALLKCANQFRFRPDKPDRDRAREYHALMQRRAKA